MALDHKIRIIGGFLKGRKLEVLDLEGLRPRISLQALAL